MSILVVEDNRISQKILMLNLKKHGFKIRLASNGKEALEILMSDISIQLVVTDIMMPDMDGLELLDTMTNHPELKNIPVVVCSSLKDFTTVKEAVEKGCDSYLVKPVIAGQLVQKVRDILGEDECELLDVQQVMLRQNMDKESYRDIANAFLKTIQDVVVFLRMNRNEEKNIHYDLRELLGGSQIVGAGNVIAILKRIMTSEEDSLTVLRKRDRLVLLDALHDLTQLVKAAIYDENHPDSLITISESSNPMAETVNE